MGFKAALRAQIIGGASVIALASGSPLLAAQTSDKAAAPTPASAARDHYDAGVAAAEKGDSDLAIAEYSKAIDADPKNALAYYARALVKSRQRNYAAAIADSSEAIALNSTYFYPYLARASDYAALRKFDEAIADEQAAIALKPKESSGYSSLGDTYLAKNDLPLAIVNLSKGLELKPEDAYALRKRATAYYMSKRYSDAVADLTKAISLEPRNTQLYLLRAACYQISGDVKASAADFAFLTTLEPKNVGYWWHLVHAQTDLAQYDAAIATLHTLQDLKFSPAVIFGQLGYIDALRGKASESQANYNESFKTATKQDLDYALYVVRAGIKSHPENALLVNAETLLVDQAKEKK